MVNISLTDEEFECMLFQLGVKSYVDMKRTVGDFELVMGTVAHKLKSLERDPAAPIDKEAAWRALNEIARSF